MTLSTRSVPPAWAMTRRHRYAINGDRPRGCRQTLCDGWGCVCVESFTRTVRSRYLTLAMRNATRLAVSNSQHQGSVDSMSKIYRARMSRRESIKRLSAMTAVVLVGGSRLPVTPSNRKAPQATGARHRRVTGPAYRAGAHHRAGLRDRTRIVSRTDSPLVF